MTPSALESGLAKLRGAKDIEHFRILTPAEAAALLARLDALDTALTECVDALPCDTCNGPGQQPRAGVCPKCDGESIWLLVYEDQDMEPVLFSNHGADEAARKAFEHAATKWTVRLFKCVAQDGYGPGTGQQPSREPGVCQHDLLEPNCTVVVADDDPFVGHCSVCDVTWTTRAPGTGQQPAQPKPTFHSKSEAKRVTALMQQPSSGEVKRYVGRITELEPSPVQHVVLASDFERLQSAERGKLAAWMIRHDLGTGHGDTTEALLAELGAQVAQLLAAAQQEVQRNKDGWAEAFRLGIQHQDRADALQTQLTTAQQRIADLHEALRGEGESAEGWTDDDYLQAAREGDADAREVGRLAGRIAKMGGHGQCICPNCGLRHGSPSKDEGF
jgi:hypothetical protein